MYLGYVLLTRGFPEQRKKPLIASTPTTPLLPRYAHFHKPTPHAVESASEQTLISGTRLEYRGPTHNICMVTRLTEGNVKTADLVFPQRLLLSQVLLVADGMYRVYAMIF